MAHRYRSSKAAENLVDYYTSLPNEDLDVHEITDFLRGHHLDVQQTHLLCDLLDGMWDEIERLRATLDQSKGDKVE